MAQVGWTVLSLTQPTCLKLKALKSKKHLAIGPLDLDLSTDTRGNGCHTLHAGSPTVYSTYNDDRNRITTLK